MSGREEDLEHADVEPDGTTSGEVAGLLDLR